MEQSPCVFCLKRVEAHPLPHSPSTQDVGSLYKLLTLDSLPRANNDLISDQDGNNCSLCSTCTELIQEMGQIREQISQLQNQIGKRIGLVRKMILHSDVKRLEKILHCEVDEMEKLREIRENLLRLSVPDDNFVTTEVEVKLEPEDIFDDDTFLQDPLDHHQPSSPSALLLQPDEDGPSLKNEEGGGDSDDSFSINPQQSHKRRKLNLRRSGRSTRTIKTENGKTKKTSLPKKKKVSSSSEPKMKPQRKISSPPPTKKRRQSKNSSPPISDSDTESSSADDPEFNPLPMLKNKVKIKKLRKPNLKWTKNFPFKCSHCSKRFSTEEKLSHHVQHSHSFKCQNCDGSFRTRQMLYIHHKAQHSSVPFAQCTICKKRFRESRQHLEEHMVIHHETEDKAFFCDKCNKGFTLEVNYKRHLDLHKVEDLKPLVCEICDSRFSDQTRLDKHFAHHSKSNCDICPQVFANTTALARHMRTHTGERPYKCDHCEETFIDHHSKQYHTSKIHATPDQHHLCPVCGRTFFDLSNLKIHIARHDGTSMVSCDQCGEKFKEKSTLLSHKIDKHGADPFVCDECGATFKTANGLTYHKLAHVGDKRLKCDICDARFLKQQVLTQHMRKHTGERPFPCSECELRFKFKKNLSTHVKKIHTPDYVTPTPHACSYPGCTKRFQYKSNLDNHFRQVHTTERPFVCEICNKGCATRSFLSLHKKLAHGIHVPVTEGGGKLPKSKRQFPSTNFDNSDINTTARRRIKKRISNPRPPSNYTTSDSNSEPPTRGDAAININRNSSIPPVFQNPSYFSNYYHL